MPSKSVQLLKRFQLLIKSTVMMVNKTSIAYLVTLAILIFFGCDTPQNKATDKSQTESTKTDSLIVISSKDSLAKASQDILMHPEYARSLARLAYIWGYPMVDMLNRKIALSKSPAPGRLGGVIPVAPTGYLAMLYDYIDPMQTFIACPNQDVVYGLGYFSLDEQPVIIQVPDFGSRFWVYAIYDYRTNQVGRLGQPYGSKPGFYLLKGPHWNGKVPTGITAVIDCPTVIANCVPRVFMDDNDADRQAIQQFINQIVVYPLTEFNGTIKTINWKSVPSFPKPAESGSGETKWVVPEKYFDEFGEILETLPPLPGEESLYSQFRSLMAVAGKSPDVKKLITAEVVTLDKTLIKDFMQWSYNGKPAGNGWNRSQNNAQWGYDYYNRVGTSKSNMFDNRPNETQYYYTDSTSDGQKLTGKNNYKITFKELPPVKGFWSMTLYNKEHFFYPNSLKRFSLGTKNKTLQKNPDGSLTLYAGNKYPGADKMSNWLPAPSDDFSLYIRAYWGEIGITEGSWAPPVIEKY